MNLAQNYMFALNQRWAALQPARQHWLIDFDKGTAGWIKWFGGLSLPRPPTSGLNQMC